MSTPRKKPNSQLFASQSSDPIPSYHQDSICWNCIHASPSHTTGCSWSKRFIPVPDSTYIPGGKLPNNQGRGLIIQACPQFEKLHQFTTLTEVYTHLSTHFKMGIPHLRERLPWYVAQYLKACKSDPTLIPLPGWFLAQVDEIRARQKEGLPLKRGAEK